MDDLLAYCGNPLVVFDVQLPTIPRLSLSNNLYRHQMSEAPSLDPRRSEQMSERTTDWQIKGQTDRLTNNERDRPRTDEPSLTLERSLPHPSLACSNGLTDF
jgi:hypothetical protein